MSDELEIQNLLDELKTAEVSAEELAKKKKQAVDEIMPAEIKRFLEDIDKDFLSDEQASVNRIGELHDRIKAEVLNIGKTVTGQFKMAVFRQGSTTWNSEGLKGYAVGAPEILAFQKIGKPNVAIMDVK
jgi:septation ring formation regulator EzrA